MADTAPAEWINYLYEIYFQGLAGETPDYPIDFELLHAGAKEQLDEGAYGYVAGAAGLESTLRANRRAFDRWEIWPRTMVDISERFTATEVLGTALPAPLLLAPVGVLSIVHERGEVEVAEGAASVGVPIVLSTAASNTIEDVADAMGEVPRWYQLYWPDDRELTKSFVQRAEEAGFEAIVVTVDTKLIGWRPVDLRTAYLPFLQGEGIANYTSDPVFRDAVEGDIDEDPQAAIGHWVNVFSDHSVDWDDLVWLRDETDLPIVLKGVLHPEDARLAQEHGADGIVVSNHGGRQVDGSVGALDVLPEIAEAVPEMTLLFDSGIRSGADIYKALCLGASAVLLGRPYVWGLGLGGADGVRHVLRTILAEFELTMALTGATRLEDLGPERLRPAPGYHGRD
ncbi:MAG: alpha-hydroxy-acid oxidizing protein [Nitriliruptorales bacterium]|nr:alpha-hydroxy-acid oxidizing protein [Nitriliruptorales bacterium]